MAYKFSIGATTLSGSVTFKDGLSANDSDISNVGDINVDSISVDGAATGLNIDGSGANTTKFKITMADNLADALNINEGGNSYMKFTTTNSSEQIVFGKNSTFASTTIANLGTVSAATSITATDLIGTNVDGIIGADTARAGTFTAVVGTTGTYSGILKSDDTTDATSKTDGSLQTDGGLSVAKAIYNGTAATLAADSGVVTIGSATAATFSAAGLLNINNATDATSTTDGSLQTDGGLSVVKDIVAGNDLVMKSDAAIIAFGDDAEVKITHVADVGLTITNTNAADDKPIVLQLKSEEDVVIADEVIASIEFAAGDSDGTDGATVAAGIHAIAEEAFAADANATKLVFTTADSETAAASATAKMTLASTGNLTTAGSVTAVGSFIIGSADMSEADLEKLDGITNGTAAASKAVVLDASKNIATIGTVGCGAITSTGASSFGSINVGGTITGDTSLTLDDTTITTAEIGVLDSVAAGTAAASKAVVLDASKNIATIGTVGCGAITSTGASTFGSVSPASADGGALGGASAEWSDLYLADNGVVYMGNDQEVSMTHSPDAGIIMQNVNAGNINGMALSLRLSSSSPADGDEIGALLFSSYTDTATNVNAAAIVGKIEDVSNDSRDGSLNFAVMLADNMTNMMDINSTADATTTMQEIVNLADHNGSSKGLKLGGTLVSSTAAELNKLDGVNATTAEINYLDLTTLGTSEASKVVSADASGDITIAGAAANMVWDKSADALEFADNASAEFGTGLDMKLYHDGTDSYIANAVGTLKIATTTSGIAVSIGHTTSNTTVNDNLIVTGDLTVNGTTTSVNSTTIAITSSFTFEGATPDAHETVLGVVDPTADATINLPAMSAGTYYLPVLAAATTTAIGATPAEIDAACDASARTAATIAVGDDHFLFCDGGATGATKVESIADLMTAVAGSGLDASSGVLELDIDGLTALGGATVAQADLLIIDDGAGGTNKSVTFSNLEDSIFGNVSGDATIAAGGALTIAADAVEPSMMNIFDDSLAATTTHFLIADGTDYSSFALSGDVTCTNAGVVTIADDAVEGSMLNTDVISAQTELASGGAVDADEMMISDGGTLKKIGLDSLKTYMLEVTIQNIAAGGTAVVGMNYFSDMGSDGEDSVTLPASPAVGDIVYIKAPSDCAAARYITIDKAGSQTIDGATEIRLESPYAAVSLCYVATNVWRIF